jgi:hypothetical protein
VNAELKAQGYSGAGSRGGFGGGNRGGAGGAGGAGGGGGKKAGGGGGAAASGPTGGTAGGEVSLAGSPVVPAAQGGGGFQGGGGMQVSDADCKKIDDVLKAHPKEKKQLDDLRAKMTALRPASFGGGRGAPGGGGGGANRNRSAAGGDSAQGGGQRRRGGGAGGDSTRAGGGNRGGGGGGRGGSPEMQAINEQMRAIYTTLNLDARTAGMCARRAQGANAGQFAGAAGGTRGGQRGQNGALTPSPELSARPVRAKQGLVYVSDSSKTIFHPRIVQLGQGNLDYTEVLSGLKEGERVVMLGALALQAQRIQQQDRARANASPLGGQPTPGGPGGPGGGGARGAGGGGGRGG